MPSLLTLHGGRGGESPNFFLMPLWRPNTKPQTKQRKYNDVEPSSSDEETVDNWSSFLIMEGGDAGGQPVKLNPFAIDKGLKGHAGTLKNVTRLRSGFLLLECFTKQQSTNLHTPHRFLNTSKGIVRDRARVLSDMTEDELCKALASEGVTNIKRFTFRDGDMVRPSNTYLMEFFISCSSFLNQNWFLSHGSGVVYSKSTAMLQMPKIRSWLSCLPWTPDLLCMWQ